MIVQSGICRFLQAHVDLFAQEAVPGTTTAPGSGDRQLGAGQLGAWM